MADIPYRAIGLMADTAKLAAQHGLKSGIIRAGAKVNPVLLVLESAYSVTVAVKSFIDLKKARLERDGLRAEVDGLTEELRLGREKLVSQLDVARMELEQRVDVTESIQTIVRLTQQAFSLAMGDYADARSQNLPDLDAIDEAKSELDDAWGQMREALRQYQAVSLGGMSNG